MLTCRSTGIRHPAAVAEAMVRIALRRRSQGPQMESGGPGRAATRGRQVGGPHGDSIRIPTHLDTTKRHREPVRLLQTR